MRFTHRQAAAGDLPRMVDIYNRAVADAQARIQEAALEIDSACYEVDLGYWNKK